MFSGIVEEAAVVTRLVKDKDNLHITLKCSFTDEVIKPFSVGLTSVCSRVLTAFSTASCSIAPATIWPAILFTIKLIDSVAPAVMTMLLACAVDRKSVV